MLLSVTPCSESTTRTREQMHTSSRTGASLGDPGPPVRSYGLSQDLLPVWEYAAERCVRPRHIKCECFPLSNLIMDFYGGISRHTVRRSKRMVIELFSFRVIYGMGGIITEWGNSLWMTEMLMCSDGFNVRSSGEFAADWRKTFFPVLVFGLDPSDIAVWLSLPPSHSFRASTVMKWLKVLSSE